MKPPYEMTDEELAKAPTIEAHDEYARRFNKALKHGDPTPMNYETWLELERFNYLHQMEDNDTRFHKILDDLWELVYPGKTDWDYPQMVYRHVRDYIEELKGKVSK